MKINFRKYRKLNKLYADIFGYFWLSCPICGKMFGGYETGKIVKNNKLTCWRHNI